MITSCSHTFCSICIRRYLSQEGRCPACREPDQELKLRRNWTVEELVSHFVASRAGILDLARRKPSQRSDSRPHKRRRIETEVNEKRSTRSQTKQSSQSIKSEIADSDDGSVYEAEDIERKVKRVEDDGLVECPNCTRRMKEAAINGHLDRCLSEMASPEPPPTQKTQPSLSLGPTTKPLSTVAPTRLPSINYALYKEIALRKKLRELGIPDQGTREALKKRHTEWMNLWNANCDSAKPRPKRELLRELDSWERTQNRQNVQGNGIMAKEFDRDGWVKEHNGDFEGLIKQAKEKARLAKEMREKTAKEEDNEKTGKAITNEQMDGVETSDGDNSKLISVLDRALEMNRELDEALRQDLEGYDDASSLAEDEKELVNGEPDTKDISTPRKQVNSSIDLTMSPLTPDTAKFSSSQAHSVANRPPVLSRHFP